ncbi:hypothetical protein [Pseudoramibacter alactolyticus]|nr:hypothetical protein [Pseudoramibacter alactolyticus]
MKAFLETLALCMFAMAAVKGIWALVLWIKERREENGTDQYS